MTPVGEDWSEVIIPVTLVTTDTGPTWSHVWSNNCWTHSWRALVQHIVWVDPGLSWDVKCLWCENEFFLPSSSPWWCFSSSITSRFCVIFLIRVFLRFPFFLFICTYILNFLLFEQIGNNLDCLVIVPPTFNSEVKMLSTSLCNHVWMCVCHGFYDDWVEKRHPPGGQTVTQWHFHLNVHCTYYFRCEPWYQDTMVPRPWALLPWHFFLIFWCTGSSFFL
jgi:hypothetical protein